MELSPERKDQILQALKDRDLVPASAWAECKRIAKRREMGGTPTCALDLLVELGQTDQATVAKLDRELPQLQAAPKKSNPQVNLIIAGVSLPILLFLAYLAVRDKPRDDRRPPDSVPSGPTDWEVALPDKDGGDKTIDQAERDKALVEWTKRMEKRNAPRGKTPTLGAGQSAYVSDKKTVADDPELRDHFAPFSLVYPSSWTATTAESQPNANSYVRLERYADAEKQVLLESVSVGYLHAVGPVKSKLQLIEKVLPKIEKSLAATAPHLHRERQENTKVAGVDVLCVDYTDTVKKPTPVTHFYRLIFFPPGTADLAHGVVVMLVATANSPDCRTLADLGVKGEAPQIVQSLVLGGE